MEPGGNRPGLEVEVGEREDTGLPTLTATAGDEASPFVSLGVEPENLHDDIEHRGGAGHLPLLVEDGQEGRKLLVGAVRARCDGLDEFSERLRHNKQPTR